MSTTRSPHLVTTDTPAAPGAVVPRDRLLVKVAAAVTAVSVAGALLAVATGLSAGWADAVGPTARLSAPLPMNLALVVLALVAAGTRRRLGLSAGALLALACTAAVVSGPFDGGYSARLAPVERLCQVALVLGLTTLGVLAGRRAVRLRRG